MHVLILAMLMQDKKASSSMDGVLDLAEIHGLLRQAINLLKGCEISVEDGTFNFIVTSAFSWFRVGYTSLPLLRHANEHAFP